MGMKLQNQLGREENWRNNVFDHVYINFFQKKNKIFEIQDQQLMSTHYWIYMIIIITTS